MARVEQSGAPEQRPVPSIGAGWRARSIAVAPHPPSGHSVLVTKAGDIVREVLRGARSLVRRPDKVSEPSIAAPVERVYESLYEAVAQSFGDEGVGGGDYNEIGEIELDVLCACGLQPDSALLDFGCGNGRLAIHAVSFLQRGKYVGIDIAPTFLANAANRLRPVMANSSCDVQLVHQVDERFSLPDDSIDIGCAFSVFTHMEHEDMYRYLAQLKRVVRPGGTMVISCLPLNLDYARLTFVKEAELDVTGRWQRPRNVTTSVDLVNVIAQLAGWTVVRWLPGDEHQALSQAGVPRSLGQSIAVLTH
jgi:SAM-dependent methyltransferase